MVKKLGNQVIKKSSNDKRFFEEKRTNLKYKKQNRVYTIHWEDYKRKLTEWIDAIVNCIPIRVKTKSKLTNFMKIIRIEGYNGK